MRGQTTVARQRILTPPARLVEAYETGLSVNAVAALYGMSYGAAYNRLRTAGVLRKWGGSRRRVA
jgi:hypothetical protein